MLEGVTIEQLRTLRAVAEAGSFSAAARKLGRVQAAVSQSIDRLEAQLGLRLFDRSGRVPRLTAARRGRRRGGGAGSRATSRRSTSSSRASSAARRRRCRIVVDVHVPDRRRWWRSRRSSRAEHPTVELVLFTEVLSAVTAHVREKRSTWGIALEDADLERPRPPRRSPTCASCPVAAPAHPLARREGPIDAAALADAVQIVLGEHRHEAERGVGRPRRLLAADAGAWSISRRSTRSSPAASAGGTCPSTSCATTSRAGRLVELRARGLGQRGAAALAGARAGGADAVMGPVARVGAGAPRRALPAATVEPGERANHADVMGGITPRRSFRRAPARLP